MRIISKRRLREFWERFPDAQEQLEAWHALVIGEHWSGPHDVKAVWRSASILKKGRVVFNVGGNKYRLIVHVRFDKEIVFVRFVGTHEEYDNVDAETV